MACCMAVPLPHLYSGGLFITFSALPVALDHLPSRLLPGSLQGCATSSTFALVTFSPHSVSYWSPCTPCRPACCSAYCRAVPSPQRLLLLRFPHIQLPVGRPGPATAPLAAGLGAGLCQLLNACLFCVFLTFSLLLVALGPLPPHLLQGCVTSSTLSLGTFSKKK